MGKGKRSAIKHSSHHDNPLARKKSAARRQYSQQPPAKVKQVQSKGPSQADNGQTRLKVPFTKHDIILLVGEGDFSFTQSLLQHHSFHHITSTCFDTEAEFHNKYPSAANRVLRVWSRQQSSALQNVSSIPIPSEDDPGSELEWNGFSPQVSDGEQKGTNSLEKHDSVKIDVHFNIDATKLNTMHRKMLQKRGPYTKIIFNFPHVGGLSTDVNRQVRTNQQLLVGFFNTAKVHLASTTNPASKKEDVGGNSDWDSDFDVETGEQLTPLQYTQGQILVTLFEGEPYTLWNIRDLARHCGLKVIESFKFPWKAYPGYTHARTMGDIATGKDRAKEGKRKGAWRGEEREARCYVLELNRGTTDSTEMKDNSVRKRKEQHGSDNDSN